MIDASTAGNWHSKYQRRSFWKVGVDVGFCVWQVLPPSENTRLIAAVDQGAEREITIAVGVFFCGRGELFMSAIACPAPAAPGQLRTRRFAAEYLGVSMATLSKWANARRFLPFVKVGKSVRYRQADLDRFLDSRTVPIEA